MKYLIVIEPSKTGFSALAGLPGCVATGKTRKQVQRQMAEAIEFHLEGLREEGERIPRPRADSAFVEVA